MRQSVAFALEKLDSSLKIIQAGNAQESLALLRENPQIQTAIIDLCLVQGNEVANDIRGGGGYK